MTAYILDTAALHPMTVRRIAGHIARENGLSYETVVGMLSDGWLIPAQDCELVNEQAHSPVFLSPFPIYGGFALANIGRGSATAVTPALV